MTRTGDSPAPLPAEDASVGGPGPTIGPTTGRIRVVIADDHSIVRAGVRMLLESQSDIDVVGEASDGREAVALIRRFRPDVALMDITMPHMTGLDATREVRRLVPATRVLVLTMHGSDEYFFHLLNAGASGYLLKDSAPSDLVSAVRAVHAGGVFIHPTLQRRLLGEYLVHARSGGQEGESLERLSERERDVLRLIAEGCTSSEIAQRLIVTVNTVQTHRRHIMEKLDLHDRGQLVRYAIRIGLLRPSDAPAPDAGA
ncbi:MAG TPA: response regulator transcription factor [Chloroflexota bacterium]|nr:response regulator transcription factor [Chloroflexota bacterium]